MTRTRRAAFFTAGVLLALTGCDAILDPDGDGDPALVGDWLGVSYVLVNAENESQAVDLIVDEGWFEYLAFEADGTHLVYEDGADGYYEDFGTWSVLDDVLSLSYQVIPETIEVTWEVDAQDRLILRVDSAEGWDFDGDGGDEPTHETITLIRARTASDPDLVGDWAATSYVLTANDASGATHDVIAGGGSLTLSILADGAFSYTEDLGDGQGADSEDGAILAANGTFWIYQPGEAPEAVGYAFEGDVLVLTQTDESYDFDGDGSDESARVVIRLARQ